MRLRFLQALFQLIKQVVEIGYLVVKFILKLTASIVLLGLCTFLSLNALLFLISYKVTAFFPIIPRHIGSEAVGGYEIDQEILNYPLAVGNFQIPDYDKTKDSLARYLFQDFKLEKDQQQTLMKEKEALISNLFPYQKLNNVRPYVQILSVLPIGLLELMVADELYFIVSDYPPTDVGDNKRLVAYYEHDENRIVLFSGDTQTSLIHELGHWIGDYIRRHIDFYYTFRIEEEMIAEIYELGLPDNLIDYSKTTTNEFFAVSFQSYMYHYELVKSKAPITFEYFSYYLSKILTLSFK